MVTIENESGETLTIDDDIAIEFNIQKGCKVSADVIAKARERQIESRLNRPKAKQETVVLVAEDLLL